MQQYDVRLKAIFYRAVPRLLGVLGLPPLAEYLTVEFPIREKAEADFVARLTDERILHVELLTRNDPRMIWRDLGYWQVIGELWPTGDIVQVVVYLGEAPVDMVSKALNFLPFSANLSPDRHPD